MGNLYLFHSCTHRSIPPYYAEPSEPVLEAIDKFINADNPTWEGTATELIDKLELDIKPNALSLKLNVKAGKLYNLYFVQYSNSRSHKGRKIMLRYDDSHPIIVEPESDTDDIAEDEFQYQPVEGDPKVTVCYIKGDSGNKSFRDMTDAEKENFLVTSY